MQHSHSINRIVAWFPQEQTLGMHPCLSSTDFDRHTLYNMTLAILVRANLPERHVSRVSNNGDGCPNLR